MLSDAYAMLLKRGCQVADQTKMDMFLMASADISHLRLLEAHGFKPFESIWKPIARRAVNIPGM